MPVISAKPFDFEFAPETLALVVIDMQRDFVEPGGFGESLGNNVSRLQAAVPAIERLLAGFRAKGLPVFIRANAIDLTCRIARQPNATGAIPAPG